MTRYCGALLLSCSLIGVVLADVGASDWMPVALASFPAAGGDEAVAVLTRSSELWILRRSSSRAELLAKSFLVGQPVDLAVGAEAAVVTGQRHSVGTTFAEIAVLSPVRGTAPPARTVVQGALFAGVAIDWKRGQAYVAEVVRKEIRTMPLGARKSSPAFWTAMVPSSRGDSEPGSLVLDNPQDPRKLFVAAPAQGAVYVIDLGSRVPSRLPGDFGDIRALTVDRGANRLMIADATCRCVWAVSLTPPAGKPAVQQLLSGQLRQPLGLAWTTAGLWVADARAETVLLVDAAGKRLREFKP